MATTIDQLQLVQHLQHRAEELHLRIELLEGSRIAFTPDRKHYPQYAEGARFGYCSTVEEAYGFLNGFIQGLEYYELGKGERR